MNIIIRILLSSLGVLIADYILPGVEVKDFFSAFVTAVILGVLNWTIRPILILFTIPLTVFSLGLFLFVINALIILMVDWIVPGFQVDGFWWALLLSLVLTILNSFFKDISGSKNVQK